MEPLNRHFLDALQDTLQLLHLLLHMSGAGSVSIQRTSSRSKHIAAIPDRSQVDFHARNVSVWPSE